ncbi:MAG: aminoacyl-tRNA hydrolase [Thermoleophilia bacterium]|jgi:ribosome-associated protein|nr:aminoacyl-tRNA hydrolase [Thermoleophilia bacterium]
MTAAERMRLAALAVSAARIGYSRASGPGGQHRDTAETRAELVLAEADLAASDPADRDRLVAALGLARRPVRLSAQDDRSQARNRAAVEMRLRERVIRALTPPRPRRPTRPTTGSVERRLKQKAARAERKRARRGGWEESG